MTSLRIAQRRSRARAPATRPRLHVEPLETRLLLSVTLIHDTFEAESIGGLPSSADHFWNATGPGGFVQIAGLFGTYDPPFGAATNKALAIDNPGTVQPIVTWTSAFSEDPTVFRTGTISFDLYLPEPDPEDTWTYLDFRLGYGGAGRTAPTTIGDTTVWNSFRINRSSPDIVFNNGAGSGQSTVAGDAVLNVVYALDGENETYQLSINGAAIDFGTGTVDHPWIAGATGVNMFGFFGGSPTTSSPLFIDNLVVVQDETIDPPEPWAPPGDEPTDLLQWHQHRGNGRLTGRAQIDDDIVTDADILWSEFVGARESWVAVAPQAGDSTVALPATNLLLSQAERISWDLGGPYFDLDGTGTLTAQSTSSLRRVGDFIPGNGTLELLEGEVFDTTFGQGAIRLYVRSGSTWVQQWQSETIPAMFGTPNLITGDFDNDNQLEVALTPWTNLYVLDMATGQIEETGRFKPDPNESGRPYGWLGAIDVAGDDRQEFVLMGDFQDFISVMGWDSGGNLVRLWDHVFEPQLAGKQTAHRPVAFPVRDITGDGQPEIVTSVFNENDDQRWHLLVFDAATGTILHDLPDHAIDGARDIDGDGDFELFVRQSNGALLPTFGTIKILDWNGSGFATRFSRDGVGFVSQDISDFPDHLNSATATGKLDLLTGRLAAGEDPVFFTRQLLDAATNQVQVDAWQWDESGAVRSLGVATGTNLDAIAVREVAGTLASILFSTAVVGTPAPLPADFNKDGEVDGDDFLIWQGNFGTPSGASANDGDADRDGDVDGEDFLAWQASFGVAAEHRVSLSRFTGDPVFSQGSGPPRASAVVARLDGAASPPTVILQGGSEIIAALQPQIDGTVTTAWSRSGHGGSNGASQFTGQHEFSGVAVGDVTGDGLLETVYATVGASGQARLAAVRSDGDEVWHTDFDVPGGPRVFNEPGLTLWRTGNFTSTEYQDVLVQIMRGTGGTGEFHLLDGRSGDLIWMRDFGNTPGSHAVSRAAGEAHLAVYDWDRDGLDEAVNFHPDMYYVVDGDGTNLVDRAVLGGGVFPGGSPLYGTPIVDDFLNNGTDTVLWAGSYAQLGLVSNSGVDIWHTPFVFDDTPGFVQGVGDVDGDGDLDLLSPGHPDSPGDDTQSFFHAIDAGTGQLLWRIPLPGRAYAPVGGAYSDSPTLSVSADVDQDGRDESVFAIATTLYVVGADPDGTSGRIEFSFQPDGGLLGAPVIADANGDGVAEIVVVSTTGFVYGIGQGNVAGQGAQVEGRHHRVSHNRVAFAAAVAAASTPEHRLSDLVVNAGRIENTPTIETTSILQPGGRGSSSPFAKSTPRIPIADRSDSELREVGETTFARTHRWLDSWVEDTSLAEEIARRATRYPGPSRQ